MRKITAAAATLAAVGMASSVQAAEAGDIQVKLMGSAVLPNGEITSLDKDLVGLPAGTQTEANDNYVPTLAIEYFFSSNLSLETICCLTQHDVDTVSGLPAGSELVADAKILPATLTLKYHFGNGAGIKPYIGAGPTYFFFIDEQPGATAVAVGADEFHLNNKLGAVLQAGVDVPIGEKAAISLDAKKYFLSTSAHWFAAGTEVITTQHKLDPWVLSAGVGFTF